MNKSEQINELAAALSLAQKEIEGAIKDTTNTFFKNKYADLSSVMDALRDPFSKNGLSYAQCSRVTDAGQLVLVTMLMHKSGQWISGEYPVRGVKDDPQALGSATTYARRYALSAICGVSQVDDDGNYSSGKTTQYNQQSQPQQKPGQAIFNSAKTKIEACKTLEEIDALMENVKKAWSICPDTMKDDISFMASEKKNKLKV